MPNPAFEQADLPDLDAPAIKAFLGCNQVPHPKVNLLEYFPLSLYEVGGIEAPLRSDIIEGAIGAAVGVVGWTVGNWPIRVVSMFGAVRAAAGGAIKNSTEHGLGVIPRLVATADSPTTTDAQGPVAGTGLTDTPFIAHGTAAAQEPDHAVLRAGDFVAYPGDRLVYVATGLAAGDEAWATLLYQMVGRGARPPR